MRIITNEKLIKRNALIGKITSLLGLVGLVGGLVLGFREDQTINQLYLSFGGLLAGFSFSQIGIYLGNRYARNPRPDQAINAALKGFDKSYTLYHFIAPIAHLLVGPSGVWALIPKVQGGRISFEGKRWKQRGGVGLNYMKIFAQESIGRPDLEIDAEIKILAKFFDKRLAELKIPEALTALVFTNPKAELLDVKEAPAPTVAGKKLKDVIRKFDTKGHNLSAKQMKGIKELLEEHVTEEMVS